MMKKICIVGGETAGLVTALILKKCYDNTLNVLGHKEFLQSFYYK